MPYRAMQRHPSIPQGGEHFKVDAERWRGVLGSGLFNGAQLSGTLRCVTSPSKAKNTVFSVYTSYTTSMIFSQSMPTYICTSIHTYELFLIIASGVLSFSAGTYVRLSTDRGLALAVPPHRVGFVAADHQSHSPTCSLR